MYLKGSRFTIRTSREDLAWILNITDSAKRPARGRLKLSEFKFDVVQRAGIKQPAVDALTRINTSGKDESPSEDDQLLYASNSFDSPPDSAHTAAHEKRRAQSVRNSNKADDKTKCDPSTAVDLIQA